MRSRFVTSPWWVHGLIDWMTFAVIMTPTLMIDVDAGAGWLWAAISAGVGGAIPAFITGRWTARQCARWRAAAGDDLSAVELRAVHRAMTRGPLPTETTIRKATARAAAYTLRERHDDQVPIAVLLVAFIAGFLVLGVASSPWWLVGVPVFVHLAHETWAEPRRLRARIELLSREPDQHPA